MAAVTFSVIYIIPIIIILLFVTFVIIYTSSVRKDKKILQEITFKILIVPRNAYT